VFKESGGIEYSSDIAAILTHDREKSRAADGKHRIVDFSILKNRNAELHLVREVGSRSARIKGTVRAPRCTTIDCHALVLVHQLAPECTGKDTLMHSNTMDSTALWCHPRNPNRPLDWKWQLAGTLAGQARRAGRRHDAAVHRCARFRRALDSGMDARRLDRLDPELNTAFRVHIGDAQARIEVQARLLAAQTDAEIAVCCGLPAAAIEVYHASFFEARPLLGSSSAILFRVCPRICTGQAPSEDELVLYYAYRGGVHALDMLLDYLHGAPSDDPEILWRRALVRLAVATRSLPHDAANIRLLHLLPEFGAPDYDEIGALSRVMGSVEASTDLLLVIVADAQNRSVGRLATKESVGIDPAGRSGAFDSLWVRSA
jgi:hypothetical protein